MLVCPREIHHRRNEKRERRKEEGRRESSLCDLTVTSRVWLSTTISVFGARCRPHALLSVAVVCPSVVGAPPCTSWAGTAGSECGGNKSSYSLVGFVLVPLAVCLSFNTTPSLSCLSFAIVSSGLPRRTWVHQRIESVLVRILMWCGVRIFQERRSFRSTKHSKV